MGLYDAKSSGSGYWTAPAATGKAKQKGYEWAQKNYSPDFLANLEQANQRFAGSVDQTRQDWQGIKPQSMADMWQGYMQGSPELEQMQYNQALARLKGQMGTAQQGLMSQAGSRQGGGYGGMFAGGMEDINRQFLQGTGQIATQQAMQQIQDREARQKQLIDYTGQDINNMGGWMQGMTGAGQTALQGYGGWVGQMIPYEQYNIQMPIKLAQQQAELAMKKAGMEEQINASRRAETMGWLDRLQGWDQQQAGQFYGGQNAWQGYNQNAGNQQMGGYGPQWLPY